MDNEILLEYVKSIVECMIDTFRLPTHDTIWDTFKYSCISTVVCAVCSLFNIFTFLSWQGCLICSLALGIMLFVERNENDSLQKAYDKAKRLKNKVAERLQK